MAKPQPFEIDVSPGIKIFTEPSSGGDSIEISVQVDQQVTGYSQKMANEIEKGIINLINAHVRDIKSWDHKE